MENGSLTVDRVKARALQLRKESEGDQVLIIIDYLQRWALGIKEFSELRHQVSSLGERSPGAWPWN